MQIVNQTIPAALKKLGYAGETIEAIVEYIAENGHVVDAPGLKTEHYEIFDTAMGKRSIKPMGHVLMMAACQPFLSGAISKTVNLPETATVEEIKDVYFQGWKLGLKALAVYRDNCKVGQPLSDGKEAKSSGSVEVKEVVREVIVEKPIRRRLPKSRQAITTSFSVGGAEGYMTSGAHEDGSLGEIFMKLGKQGSTLAGMMDAFSIAISISLQYGVPLETFVSKFTNMKFEPAGLTDDPDVRMSQSIMDYTFRRLALDYLDFDTRSALGIHSADERQRYLDTGSHQPVDNAGTTAAELVDNSSLASEGAPATEREGEARGEVTENTSAVESPSVSGDSHEAAASKPAPATAHTSAELFEQITGSAVDSPLCMTCGTKMRPAGSCHVCEGCGSTSGCS
jgi:ribonucleoside-diphosphate reductase alpha chain